MPLVMTGPATHSTWPLGSKHAGASKARIRLPFESLGKFGPATQVPLDVAVAPDV